MTIAPDSVDVRRIVVQTFLELDVTEDDVADLEETLLVEVGIVQFYDAEGNMLRTVNLFEELRPIPIAA